MAKRTKAKAASKSTFSIETNSFNKGMNKDLNASIQPKANWSHARNAYNNSSDGDVGVIGNEPANIECGKIPYTVIGAIHKIADQWIIFSTDDIDSEIGLFDDSKCEYKTLVNDTCLNFSRKYLITGASKENFDCTWQVYFDDGNNPSRSLNIDDIPYEQIIVSAPGADCIIYEDGPNLNCEKIRLAPILDTPCVELKKAQDGGQLRNGSYRAYIAYVENEQKVTDYIGISNIQGLFEHNVNGGSLDVIVSNLDKDYEFYELVILSDNQGQKVAKRIGIYSTEQSIISIDFIDNSLPAVGLELLFLRSPAYEKSESMYVVNDYLIRQGPTEQFDFNYQPLANKIKANWVVTEYSSEYYYNGGNKVGFLRDEQYAFFIRWIYNTGEKSSSYHIPGRAPKFNGFNQFGSFPIDETQLNVGDNSIGDEDMNFQVFNTATVLEQNINEPTEDGGLILSRGEMGYWQSTEKYPATKPEIWEDLCGKYIRHHKMPTEELNSSLSLSSEFGSKIRILGVEFSEIKRPLFNDGTPIPNIVGYEILRGSREGNKSILAKGVLRNMREYDLPEAQGSIGPSKALYPNFPYNDLRADVYHHTGESDNGFDLEFSWEPDPFPRTDGCDDFSNSIENFPPLTKFRQDIFTFHSPDLMFRRPFLNAAELRIYGAYSGFSEGHFIKSENHPQQKLMRNAALIIAGLVGIGYAIAAVNGRSSTQQKGTSTYIPPMPIFVGPAGTNPPGWSVAAQLALTAGIGTSTAADIAIQTLLDDLTSVSALVDAGAFGEFTDQINAAAQQGLGALFPGVIGSGLDRKSEQTEDAGELPLILRIFTGIALSKTNITLGAQKIIDLLYNFISAEDFAFKHNSNGFLDTFSSISEGDPFRTKLMNQDYIGSSIKVFSSGDSTENFKINNLYRPDTIAIKSSKNITLPNITSGVIDKSRYTVGGDADVSFGNEYIVNPTGIQVKPISMHYGALKFNFENQYGQLENIKQTTASDCINFINNNFGNNYNYKSKIVHGGDTFVGRYTEKVIMPLFTDFLFGQPDLYPYDYLQRINIPYPRFWMNSRKFDVSAIADKITSFGLAQNDTVLPNDLFYLDRGSGTCASGQGSSVIDGLFGSKGGNSAFAMRYGYMYTHCNGILDFYVESEINLAYRDWDDKPESRYYDIERYTNTDDLFTADLIKKDNFYKYDYSLSPSRFLTNLTSGGSIQPRDYDPEIAETCFTNYPKRLLYSLQAKEEAKKDFWRVYLTNNYRDFKNKVNVIKPINKNGAIIFFPYQSPQMFQGVDTLTTTDLGTKITIGDGGLFNQPFQNLVNSDLSNEYGSCESQRGVMNTPYGFFFISQAQGKIFQQQGQTLLPISNQGMKWWFNKYLPSILMKQYPELEYNELGDNPVVGIGCQVIFDITDDVVYFCKRDFKVKDEYINQIAFDPDKGFVTVAPPLPEGETVDPGLGSNSQLESKSKFQPNNNLVPALPSTPPPFFLMPGQKLELGDPLYFEDCSWTVSYDPKSKAWLSFHDWHPELCLPSINHFLTTKTVDTDEPQCPPGYTYNPELRICEFIIRDSKPAIVTVLEESLPTQCPPGYEYNEKTGTCQLLDFVTPSCNGREYAVEQIESSSTYGSLGVKIYENTEDFTFPIVGQGINSMVFYDANNTTVNVDYQLLPGLLSERMNEAGIWNTNTGIYAPPFDEWIGLSTCIEINENKTYLFLIAGDNNVRITINGSVVFETLAPNQFNTAVDAFKYMHIFPVNLDPGIHVIETEGYNFFNTIGGFVTEIYDTTIENLTSFTTEQQVQSVTVFSTINREGTNFDLGESSACNCPEGYALTTCINGTLQCVSITTLPQECDCPEGYTLVYPNDNFGYTESTGDCIYTNPPICRKVECNCPPPPVDNFIGEETGECDNVYLAGANGDPNYKNLDPLICHYFSRQVQSPNYIHSGIWRHNYRCDLYANYYGEDYPWEVEFIENTGQMVNTVKSIEYQLETYVYKGDLENGCGDDRWHDLDFNFDESIIYNSEQVSGLLRLNLNPKEDPINALTYPIIGNNEIQILYSKVEQKYRFNQFWDTTNDRGEFSNAEQEIFITQLNGYIKDLNSANLDYDKSEIERKKFRHYYNKVILRRNRSNNRKMLLKLNNTKLNLSYR